jgi:hypothetical protein
MADKTAVRPARKSSPVKNGYLILYNAVSAILWLTVLGRIVGINVLRGSRFAYPAVGEFCKWTQTLAGMEVLHSLFGEFSLMRSYRQNQHYLPTYPSYECAALPPSQFSAFPRTS